METNTVVGATIAGLNKMQAEYYNLLASATKLQYSSDSKVRDEALKIAECIERLGQTHTAILERIKSHLASCVPISPGA